MCKIYGDIQEAEKAREFDCIPLQLTINTL